MPRLIVDRGPRRPVSHGALALVVALLALAASLPGVARADGDPASDTLIASDVFYPYSSPVAPAAQDRLNATVAHAHRDGIDLKVAVIARQGDLGSVTAAWRRPQFYAGFLDTEISFQRKVPLLVVMPNGYGVEGLSAAFTRKVLAAPSPNGPSGTVLASALSSALAGALASAGHAVSSGEHNGGSGSGRLELLLILILAALLVAGALIVLRVLSPASRSQAPGGKA